MRIGLGCMRLSTEPARNEEGALATLTSALDAGIRLFDTARAYGIGESDLSHNERLVARALRSRDVPPGVRVVTKCGMRRDGGKWIPDGRAKRIEEDAAASCDALAGIPIDILLLHAPDPRVSLATTARALARVQEEGLARRVGVCNVSRKQLEEIAAHAPVAAVEIALGAFDDTAIRSGVVAYCLARGIEVLAHSPLGGPDRAVRLARDPLLVRIAARYGVGAVDVFLAYLLAVKPEFHPMVGARRPETVRRIAAAAALVLDEEDLAVIDTRFPVLGSLRRPPVVTPSSKEVVLLMGVPGAGKSRAAEAYVARGYERLNRDAMGGTLRGIAKTLDERLSAGVERVVLDNTYVTRASRFDVVRIASKHGARVRCVHLATPLAEAQVNAILRMLQRFGRVLEPEELEKMARTDPAALAPHALSRMTRDLEPPSLDEGFYETETVRFVRDHPEGGKPATFVSLAALAPESVLTDSLARLLADTPAGAPCLVYTWKPEATAEWIATVRASAEAAGTATGHSVKLAICSHPGGRPVCWCRPPLPAMLLAFAHHHGVDLGSSTLVGGNASDRTMSRTLGMRS